MAKFLKSEHFWILICTVAYIISGVTDSETTWQVVVAVAAYIGGTSLKEFATNFFETLKKIDEILDKAGIHWEEILEDAIKKIEGKPEKEKKSIYQAMTEREELIP